MLDASFGTAKRLTATGTVSPIGGRLLGFFVSVAGGTLQLKEAEGRKTALTGTFSPTAGWHPLPIACGYRMAVAIEGELDVTFSVV